MSNDKYLNAILKCFEIKGKDMTCKEITKWAETYYPKGYFSLDSLSNCISRHLGENVLGSNCKKKSETPLFYSYPVKIKGRKTNKYGLLKWVEQKPQLQEIVWEDVILNPDNTVKIGKIRYLYK